MRRQAEQEATALLANDPSLHAVNADLIEGLAALDSGPSDDAFESMLVACVGSIFRNHGHTDYADAFNEHLNRERDPLDPTLIACDLLVGRAAGTLGGRRPNESLLRLARKISKLLVAGDKEFYASFDEAVLGTKGSLDTLASTLRKRVVNFTAAPRDLVYMYPQDAAQYVNDGRRLRLIDVWEEAPYSRAVFVHDLHGFELLRRHAPSIYVELLEALPHRDLTRSILERSDQKISAAEIGSLLKLAPPAFDADDRWIKESKLPFPILAAATRCVLSDVDRPPAAGEDAEALSADEVAAFMQEILAATAARPDGVPLGYAWLQFMIARGVRRSRWRSKEATPTGPSIPLLAALRALGAWLPMRSAPLEWVEQEDPVWCIDRAYALMAVAAYGKGLDSDAVADLIASLVERNLVSHFDIAMLATGVSHQRHLVSDAMRRIPNLAQWISRVWGRTFYSRERSRRLYPIDGSTPPNLALVIVYWSLCGLDAPEPGSSIGRQAWIELESAVRESALTEAYNPSEDSWGIAACWLAAHWVRFFPDDPPEGTAGSLNDFLAYYHAPNLRFARLALEFQTRGVPAERLRHAIPDAEILRRSVDGLDHAPAKSTKSGDAARLLALADEIDALDPMKHQPGGTGK